MSKMDMLFIYNPRAGKAQIRNHLVDILDVFVKGGYEVTVYPTQARGDAIKKTKRKKDKYDIVVCSGGDGTLDEVFTGMMQCKKKVPIGYIPAGSTNDFASSLHLSSDLLQATQNIVDGQPKQLDIGLFGKRYFSYVASFGAFTRTSYTTPQNMKNALGHTAYILSGIQELSQIRSHPLRFALSDGSIIEDKFLFGAISNSTSVGGILTLAPDRVDMADGKLELLLIRAPKDLFELSDCVRALQQKTYNSPMITFLSTDSVSVFAPEEMCWTIDGEQESGHVQIEVSCVHHAIEVITK